jgi:NADH-quinone oxidoreductase subunit A
MDRPYLSFLMLFAFVAFNAGAIIGMSHLLAPRKPTLLKDTPYESGMPPLGSAHERFSVKFYLVGMLFIIFDIETVFLIPWGTIFFAPGGGGGAAAAGAPGMGFLLIEMLVFIGILAAGYVYLWKRGALQWD